MELYFPLILDGATGTELQKRGYTGEICAEQWVLEHPEAIIDLHHKYLEAGSNIVYTPTFSANRIKLGESGILGRTREYNLRLAGICKEAVQGRALIAGDIAPTGKFLVPLGDVTFEELVDVYAEQASALEEAGVDLFVIETMMTISDARAAVLACRSVSRKPILVSFSCDANGRIVSGSDVLAALLTLQGMGISAFGLNCSSGPEDMLKHIRRLSEYAEVPLAAKPNAGLPEIVDGKTVYNCPPEEFVSCTAAFAEAGVGLFGGCCGSTPEHIAALSKAAAGIKPVRPSPVHPELLPLTTEKLAFPLAADVQPAVEFECDDDLADRLDAFDGPEHAVIAIRIDSVEQLDSFAMAQVAVTHPLCLCCDSAELLEQALRLYQGRALYSGSLSETVLEPLVRKYGLIC